jgi:beta-galactosidase
VGILFDWESWWALETPGNPSQDVRAMPLVRDWYAALFRRNVTTDFVHPTADLSRYRLLFAPALYLLDDAAIENLRRWVGDGGTLVMSFFSGIVDPNDHVRLGGYPGGLTDLLGLVVEEFAPHGDRQSNRVRADDGGEFGAELWSDVIRPEGAETVATYLDQWLAGAAAVTEHRFGRGRAIYVGTRLDAAGTAWVADRACAASGIDVARAAEGVEVVRRASDSATWTFVLNHTDAAVAVDLDDGPVTVGAKDVVVLSR